ncbi:hypothetical protein Tco_0104153 [Tanacetum coccineum]
MLFKTRTHPGALHGPMRKKLRCVEAGFTYLKIVSKSSGARDEDYFNKALLDYEAEFGVPFTLCHCCKVLRHSPKWWDQEVPKFKKKLPREARRLGLVRIKKKVAGSSGLSGSMNDEALARLMISELTTKNKTAMAIKKEECATFLEIKMREVECYEREIAMQEYKQRQEELRFYMQPFDHLTRN